jgi:hypothetical protein
MGWPLKFRPFPELDGCVEAVHVEMDNFLQSDV